MQEEKKEAEVSFDNLEIAFSDKSDQDLRLSWWIFRMMNFTFMVKLLSAITVMALKIGLPIGGLIKATIYRQFCGGETPDECKKVTDRLGKSGIGSILDYSVEGKLSEKNLQITCTEILKSIDIAKQNPDVPIACFKFSGIANFKLLQKLSENKALLKNEQEAFTRIRERFETICQYAYDRGVTIYIDAEESWIQPAIDRMSEEFMRRFNKEKAIVFVTLQMYRWDRLSYFKELIRDAEEKTYRLGVKIVRGAYIEKERERADKKGYPSPIHSSKAGTDSDYNKALELAVNHLNHVELCAGTHNEESCMILIDLMKKKQLQINHPHIYFSQLYGMSDHISYNLSHAGYLVTKYLPYGPVKTTIPYLIRRVKENSAMAGEMGRQLKLVSSEIRRRAETGSSKGE